MSRKKHHGITYFPHEALNDDDSFLYLETLYGNDAYAVYWKLRERIHRGEGYYIQWTERSSVVHSKSFNLEPAQLKEIVHALVKEGLYNKDLFEKYEVLTSVEVQEDAYFPAMWKRSEITVRESYLLVPESSFSPPSWSPTVVIVVDDEGVPIYEILKTGKKILKDSETPDRESETPEKDSAGTQTRPDQTRLDNPRPDQTNVVVTRARASPESPLREKTDEHPNAQPRASPDEVARAGLSVGLSIKPDQLGDYCARLSEHDLPPEFLEWFVRYVQTSRRKGKRVRKPARFFESFLDGSMQSKARRDIIAKYRDERAPPKPSIPDVRPTRCGLCGAGKVRQDLYGVMCLNPKCRAFGTRDDSTGEWLWERDENKGQVLSQLVGKFVRTPEIGENEVAL